ncbi:MAG: hypothetical protein KIB40_12800 [Pantoea sp.]|uniref:Uncharacterized protein n=1 Tax=Enterobacter agglomerans TaxID=549 RepID=A0ACC5PW61_ENTAG|nr:MULTISPECIES: hypothetical protein [Pantoea]MBD8129378.1 hypothetical protein [Pantoea agglomerans]MBS6034004.1 hypothetical protein [Pantoea sp.]
MSEFKGSKSPWLISGESEKWNRIVDANGDLITTCFAMQNEDDANANLIAAAPELLEACLRIQAHFRQAGIESAAGSLNPIEDNAAQIDAVILKALGR